MRGVIGIAARCVCGNPTVVATEPRLPDGTPFPTFYYLTHPGATAAMSALEATQVMRELNDDLAADEDLAASYARAHDAYLADSSAGVTKERRAERDRRSAPERDSARHSRLHRERSQSEPDRGQNSPERE